MVQNVDIGDRSSDWLVYIVWLFGGACLSRVEWGATFNLGPRHWAHHSRGLSKRADCVAVDFYNHRIDMGCVAVKAGV